MRNIAKMQRAMMGVGGGGGLPAGYIELESIGSDGYSAYIDSLVTPTSAMSFEFDLTVVKPSSIDAHVLGYYLNNGKNRFSPIGFAGSSTPHLMTQYGQNYYSDYQGKKFPLISQLHIRASINNTRTTWWVTELETGDTYEQTMTYSEQAITPAATLPLLGRYDNNVGLLESGSFRGNLGRGLIWADDHFGELVADLYPCYNGTYFGLYDTINKRFLAGNSPGNIRGFGMALGTAGFINNTHFTTGNYIVDYRSQISSPYFELPQGCTQIQMNLGTVVTDTQNSNKILYYNSNKTYLDYFNYNSADRIVSVPSTVKYVRFSVTYSDLSSTYVKDLTHNQYIWKPIII